MPKCRICNHEKGLPDFYQSEINLDGKIGRCKECVKALVRANRAKNIDYYRSYDRLRYRQDEKRRERCKSMGRTIPMKVRVEKQKERRRREPEKNFARVAVGKAIRDGRLNRGTECFFCGESKRLQAHHHDYSRPLDVFWLCSKCHGKLHTINGDFLRKEATK